MCDDLSSKIFKSGVDINLLKSPKARNPVITVGDWTAFRTDFNRPLDWTIYPQIRSLYNVYLYQKIKILVRRKMINFCLPHLAGFFGNIKTVFWHEDLSCLYILWMFVFPVSWFIYVTSIVNKGIIFSKFNKNDLRLSIY